MSTNPTNTPLKDVEAETQNEIDQILNEVEDLRRELNGQSGEITEVEGMEAENPAAAVASSAEESVPSEEELMKEFQASFGGGEAEGGGMEDTLAELKEDPTVKSLLDQTFEDQEERSHDRPEPVPAFASEPVAPVTPLSKETSAVKKDSAPVSTGSSEETPTMTMTLSGSMSLKLKYEFSGQEVCVGFADGFLKVELADGTEFKIPVARQKSIRRIA